MENRSDNENNTVRYPGSWITKDGIEEEVGSDFENNTGRYPGSWITQDGIQEEMGSSIENNTNRYPGSWITQEGIEKDNEEIFVEKWTNYQKSKNLSIMRAAKNCREEIAWMTNSDEPETDDDKSSKEVDIEKNSGKQRLETDFHEFFKKLQVRNALIEKPEEEDDPKEISTDRYMYGKKDKPEKKISSERYFGGSILKIKFANGEVKDPTMAQWGREKFPIRHSRYNYIFPIEA